MGRGRPRTPARGRRRSPWSGRMSPRRVHPRGARRCPVTDLREGNRRLPLSDRSRDMPRPLRARDGSRKSRSLTAGRKSEPRATNKNTICAIGEMNNCDNCILARHLPPPPDDRRSGVLHDRALASPGGHSSRKRRTIGVDGARPPRPTFRIARAAWRAAGPRSFGPPDHGRARTTRRGFAARAFPIPRGTLRLPDRVLRAAEGDPRRRLPPPATYRPEGCGSRRAPKGRAARRVRVRGTIVRAPGVHLPRAPRTRGSRRRPCTRRPACTADQEGHPRPTGRDAPRLRS